MRYNNKAFNLMDNLNLDLKKKITKVTVKYGDNVVIYHVGNKQHEFTFEELVKGEITLERFDNNGKV